MRIATRRVVSTATRRDPHAVLVRTSAGPYGVPMISHACRLTEFAEPGRGRMGCSFANKCYLTSNDIVREHLVGDELGPSDSIVPEHSSLVLPFSYIRAFGRSSLGDTWKEVKHYHKNYYNPPRDWRSSFDRPNVCVTSQCVGTK